MKVLFNDLWTKVHYVLGPYRGPLLVSNAIRRLSIARFAMKILAMKPRINPLKRLTVDSFFATVLFREEPRIFAAVC